MSPQHPDPQLDFFDVAQVIGPPARDYQDCMIYPFLSLQKNRTRPIVFSDRKRKIHLEIKSLPGTYIASIWDWDFLIAITSHLNEAIDRKLPTVNRVRFAPYPVLKAMSRGTSGREYQNLAHTVRRLHASHVVTNIREFDQPYGYEVGFNWLTGYRIPKKYQDSKITEISPEGEADPTRPWEVDIPDWLYNSLHRREILAIHPDYFKLTGGIERWLYRLARKAVPDKADTPSISFPLQMLYQYACVSAPIRKFRAKLAEIEAHHPLPEYGIRLLSGNKNTSVCIHRQYAETPRSRRGITDSHEFRGGTASLARGE